MQLAWFWLAVVAAAGWGMAYAFSEKLMHYVSAPTQMVFVYILSLFPFLFMFFRTEHLEEMKALSEPKPVIYLLVIVAANAVANIAVLEAFKLKNATTVSMVEVSIPLFTALTALIFFREVQVTLPLVAGGSLIMAGLFVIYYWK